MHQKNKESSSTDLILNIIKLLIHMKKNILSGLIAATLVVSCTKSTSKTEKVENPDGSVTTTTTTVSENGIGVDTSKINDVKEKTEVRIDEASRKIDKAAEDAKNKIDATADKTKENLNQAGEDVKKAAAKGASKVEEGAKKLKEDLSK
jgi:TolA-binding protein